MALLSDDHRVQTDFLFALRTFADTREKEQNWQGFCLYCMEIAATTLRVYQTEMKKDPKGLSPVELAKMDKVQSALTARRIKGVASGTAQAQEVSELVASLKGKNTSAAVTAENARLRQDIANLSKQLADSQALLTKARSDIDTELAGIKAICLDGSAKSSASGAQAAECARILGEMKAASLQGMADTQKILQEILAKTADATNKNSVQRLLAVVSGRLGSADGAEVERILATLTRVQDELRDLKTKEASWAGEKANLEVEISALRARTVSVSAESLAAAKKMNECFTPNLKNMKHVPDTTAFEALGSDFPGEFGIALKEFFVSARDIGLVCSSINEIQSKGFLESFQAQIEFLEGKRVPISLKQMFLKCFNIDSKQDGITSIEEFKKVGFTNSKKNQKLTVKEDDIIVSYDNIGNPSNLVKIQKNIMDVEKESIVMFTKNLYVMLAISMHVIQEQNWTLMFVESTKILNHLEILSNEESKFVIDNIEKLKNIMQNDSAFNRVPLKLFCKGLYFYQGRESTMKNNCKALQKFVEDTTDDKLGDFIPP